MQNMLIKKFIILVTSLTFIFLLTKDVNSAPKYSSFSLDAASGEIVHNNKGYQKRYPASLTKVMTLYIIFEDIKNNNSYLFIKGDITDKDFINNLFEEMKPDAVMHLAAESHVDNSINNPQNFINTNILGFAHILENCRHYQIEHLVYASTSSVYGANTKMPFSEHDSANHPLSVYAASKKSNELMAHTYSYLYKLPTTGLRFFTVYGPWGRPDMALFKFTKNILSDKPIEIYNKGNMVRDFTYIDDLVNAIFLLISEIPIKVNKRKDIIKNDSISDVAPFRIVNIGNSQPINLLDYVKVLENVLGKVAQKKFLGMQDGDIHKTHSDIDLLKTLTGFEPKTNIHEGISEFVKWYKSYYDGQNAYELCLADIEKYFNE